MITITGTAPRWARFFSSIPPPCISLDEPAIVVDAIKDLAMQTRKGEFELAKPVGR